MSRIVRPLSGLLSRHARISCHQSAFYHSKDGIYGCLPEKEEGSYAFEGDVIKKRIDNVNLYRLVEAYRYFGHQKATVDPLSLSSSRTPEVLNPDLYGLNDPDRVHDIHDILHTGQKSATLKDLVQILEDTYCGPLTAEFLHLPTLEEREWFASNYEAIKHESLGNEERAELASLMLKSQAFDQFLAVKFQSVKRYGGEGAESAMNFYNELFKLACQNSISDVIICIAHRGRLNLLTCLLNYPPVVMFRKMKGKREFPDDVVGSGDVLSHLTSSIDLSYGDKSVHVTMLPNPSHLEAVNPVAMGKTRGRMQTNKTGDYADHDAGARSGDGVLCFQIHGDGAFAAQGVISEGFAIADTPHFDVGGSVHLIINNQLGYTTPADRGRSGLYASDMAKINGCPVIRVNADHPEEVVKACRLAMAYRERFRRDVVVDLICYRTWGHNELDEPTFTQPIMYQAIRTRETIPNKYAQTLKEAGVCTAEVLDEHVGSWNNFLLSEFAALEDHVPKANHLSGAWSGYKQAPSSVSVWDTGVNADLLRFVGAKSVEPPTDMEIHSTLKKTHINRRLQRMESGSDLDWATAESLAFGSLLAQGYNIRISGQDVGRGTFSQRHAMLVDQKTEAVAIPLNHLFDGQTTFLEVCNSALSEEAVLGFEYGLSVEHPRRLVIWEAQFGDFFNGAQIMIDTLVTGGETKWLLQSGLVMLLPHGMDGAGPEHSSCRIERFLQMTDSKEDGIDGEDVNMSVVNPTTPAQYFHLLRRQMIRPYRKPLIVAAPKMLLRHPSCTSTIPDMTEGTHFHSVLPDPEISDPSKVTKVVLVCGKHYYTLAKERETNGAKNVALVRLEELCPFPAEELKQKLNAYPNATDFIWCQEEHRNHGGWGFIKPRIENVVGKKIRYVGREVHATPAVGVGEWHQREVKKIIEDTFA